MTLLSSMVLFAQNGAAGGGEGQPSSNLLGMLLPFIAIGFLFYFLLIRPQRRQQTRHREMLAAVKKNDRVVTAGGIYGVVTNVRTEADEVTIKVDEAQGTKLRMTLSSIASVVTGESSDDNSK